MQLSLLFGSCCTGRELVTEYSDPFFYTVYIYVAKNFFYLKPFYTSIKLILACLHVKEYFRDYPNITFCHA